MATLDSTITVDWGYRPCFVNGKKALFHRWILDADDLTAVIEFESGEAGTFHCSHVRFCDNLVSQYAFPEEQEE